MKTKQLCHGWNFVLYKICCTYYYILYIYISLRNSRFPEDVSQRISGPESQETSRTTRLTRSTWPCFSGILQKVMQFVRRTSHVLQGTRNTRSCITIVTRYMSYMRLDSQKVNHYTVMPFIIPLYRYALPNKNYLKSSIFLYKWYKMFSYSTA